MKEQPGLTMDKTVETMSSEMNEINILQMNNGLQMNFYKQNRQDAY